MWGELLKGRTAVGSRRAGVRPMQNPARPALLCSVALSQDWQMQALSVLLMAQWLVEYPGAWDMSQSSHRCSSPAHSTRRALPLLQTRLCLGADVSLAYVTVLAVCSQS